MKNSAVRFWPFLIIFVSWFIFASPYFLKGLVPYAATYQVNFFPPWSHYKEFAGPIKNNAMPDVHSQIYPWKKLTIDIYKSGQIPLWNPYSFSGTPHMANFQSAVFSPLNVLFFVFAFIHAWSLLVLLQPLLAGFFMLLFLRRLGVSNLGGVLGSITFMFCGFMVVWMAYATLGYAILYLPLAFYCIESFLQTKRRLFLLLFTLTIPLSFFSGHFQISLYFFVTVLAYVFYKAILEKNLKTVWFLVVASVTGILISLIQLWPSLQFYTASIRSSLFLLSETIPFNYLITAVAPDFFGNPVTRNDWYGHYAEWSSFVGVLPLLLAFYVAFGKEKKTLFFTLLSTASLVLAIRSPLSSVIVALKLPVISTSSLSRIIVLFSFAVATLSGFGLDELKKVIEARKLRKALFIHSGFAVFFLLVWILLFVSTILPAEKIVVAKRNFIAPSVEFVAGSILVLLTFALCRIRKIKAVLQNSLIFFLLSCLVLISAGDSLRFAKKWMPFDVASLVYPEISITQAIKKNIGEGRIFGNLGGEFTTYYRIPSIEGYDPLYIERYGEFVRSANYGEFEEGERSVVKLARRAKFANRVLDLLGVNLIFHPIADTHQGWAFPVWEDSKRFSLVYSDDKFALYKNNFALNRATLFHSYRVESDKRKEIKKFYSESFDFKQTLLLEEDPKISNSSGVSESDRVNMVLYSPNKIEIQVATSAESLLFLSDPYYPGWKAYVNEKETKLYRADYAFRAIVIPAGPSRVVFEFKGL